MKYKTGDILQAKINNIPFVYHYGIVLQNEDKTEVIHNSPLNKNIFNGNIISSSLSDFLKTRKVVHIQRTNISKNAIIEIWDKYKSLPFNLFTFNCEHFIFKIRDGHSSSPQLQNTFFFMTTITLIYYLKTHMNNTEDKKFINR